MNTKPILFNTEMVKAILEGRKTQTRRIIKPQPVNPQLFNLRWMVQSDGRDIPIASPYIPGDILWVRETWCEPYVPGEYAYRADYMYEYDIIPNPDGNIELSVNMFRWHPSIHMPKDAARIFLRVRDVHPEKIQSIHADECPSEGVWPLFSGFACDREKYYKTAFANLWDSTIKSGDREIYSWAANPWVWVIKFEQCEKPEGW